MIVAHTTKTFHRRQKRSFVGISCPYLSWFICCWVVCFIILITGIRLRILLRVGRGKLILCLVSMRLVLFIVWLLLLVLLPLSAYYAGVVVNVRYVFSFLIWCASDKCLIEQAITIGYSVGLSPKDPTYMWVMIPVNTCIGLSVLL